MQCDSASEMLDAYLDGELSVDTSAAIREHLTRCMRCSTQVADTARLKSGLRVARGHFAPSAEFRQRIRKQVARSRRRTWILPWVPITAAAAALVIFALLWTGRHQSSDALAEMADLHVNALASTNQVDVVSTDRHTGEALVSREDSLHLQSAGIRRIRLHASRRTPRVLPSATWCATHRIHAPAQDFCHDLSGLRRYRSRVPSLQRGGPANLVWNGDMAISKSSLRTRERCRPSRDRQARRHAQTG